MIINFFKKLLHAIMLYLKQFMSKNEKDTFDENHNYDYVSYTEEDDDSMVNDTDYSLKYLTFVALEDGAFSWSGFSYDYEEVENKISYSLDEGETWSEPQLIFTVQVHEGDRVLWKGVDLETVNDMIHVNGVGLFGESTCQFNVEGNIMSLIHGDDFQNNSRLFYQYIFMELFKGTKVVNAKNLIIPSMDMTQLCYTSMFENCTYLVTAPLVLPATNLFPSDWDGIGCYGYMFKNCPSLKTAPKLPATTLHSYCYQEMFLNCTSLKRAPELPASKLKQYSYDRMFKGCTNLKWIKMLATNTSETNCLREWVDGLSENGTFTKLSTMETLPSGVNGIPNNWEILNI